MPNLFVSYDLIDQKNYPKIEAAIHQLGTCSRVLFSVWYIKSPYTAEQARGHLVRATDTDDRILVIDAKDAFGQHINASAWKVVTDNWNK